MSLGIVTPSSLQAVGTKLAWRLRDHHRLHISQNYPDGKRMVSKMEKPRVMMTFLPMSVEQSKEVFESIVEHMGPLDVVIDCLVDTDEQTISRSTYCRDNSTQYICIHIDREGVFVRGPRVAYLENKNLLRKINRSIYYVGAIEEV
jgi:6-phosphogluconate dehydrogenase